MDHKPLRALRKRLGFTQAELGREIGVTAARVCHIERGLGSFRVGVWLRVFERFGREIEALGYTREDFLRGQARRGRAA